MKARTRAEIFLICVTFIWGSTFVVTKSLLDNISPFVYIAVRFSFASVLFFAIIPQKILAMDRRSCVQGTILGLLLFVGFILQTVGLQYTTASKSAFMTGMLVVFTPVFQLLIERRAPKMGNVLGILLVIAGLFLLTSPEGLEFNRGDAMTLVCAALFGVYIVYLDIFGSQSDPSRLAWMQFAVCAVLGALTIPFAETPRFNVGWGVLGALLYLAIFATIIALFVQTRFQRDTTPTRSAVIFSLEPVIAAGFAFLILGEHLGALGITGGGFIIAGVLVSEFAENLHHRESAMGVPDK